MTESHWAREGDERQALPSVESFHPRKKQLRRQRMFFVQLRTMLRNRVRLIESGKGSLETLARTVYAFSPEDHSGLIHDGNLRCALVSVDSDVKHRAPPS